MEYRPRARLEFELASSELTVLDLEQLDEPRLLLILRTALGRARVPDICLIDVCALRLVAVAECKTVGIDVDTLEDVIGEVISDDAFYRGFEQFVHTEDRTLNILGFRFEFEVNCVPDARPDRIDAV